MSIQSRAPKIMRYINNTLITIKKKHQHNIELIPSTPVPSPLAGEEKNLFLSKQVFNKLIKSTMLQLRMKGLKRTIYYLYSFLKAQLHLLLLVECDPY
jgi:hypothetical protein